VLIHKASARGAADLDRLELLVPDDAAADLVDDLPDGDAHGNFDKPGVLNFSREGEHLCALGFFGSHGGEAFRTLTHDSRHVRPGLHVVDVRGLAPEAFYGGEGRPGTGHSPLPLDGGHKGRFLAAHECARAFLDVKVETEVGSQNIVAQEAVFHGLFDGRLEPLDCQGVLGPAVNVSLVRPHGESADHHALDDGVGISFKN